MSLKNSNYPRIYEYTRAIAGEKKLDLRDDLAIEICVHDLNVTPPEQLVTHIMIPTV